MSILIVGLGNQGKKRLKYISKNKVYYVDIKSKFKKFKNYKKIPLNLFSSTFLCLPDKFKSKAVEYFVKNKKNVLVEKPFLINKKEFNFLKKKISFNKTIIYTAYNHRFEPNLIRLKKILSSKIIGKIYHLKILYGNGTAKLVKISDWKDKSEGVLLDLGSHLIDIIIFLFNRRDFKFKLISKFKFENKSNDHVLFQSINTKIKILCEASLLRWKNTFNLDIIGEKGSVHMNGLCKWGPSQLIINKRKYPSGAPKEKKISVNFPDPTWKKEHKFFYDLIKKKNTKLYLELLKKDHYISQELKKLTKKIR